MVFWDTIQQMNNIHAHENEMTWDRAVSSEEDDWVVVGEGGVSVCVSGG